MNLRHSSHLSRLMVSSLLSMHIACSGQALTGSTNAKKGAAAQEQGVDPKTKLSKDTLAADRKMLDQTALEFAKEVYQEVSSTIGDSEYTINGHKFSGLKTHYEELIASLEETGDKRSFNEQFQDVGIDAGVYDEPSDGDVEEALIAIRGEMDIQKFQSPLLTAPSLSSGLALDFYDQKHKDNQRDPDALYDNQGKIPEIGEVRFSRGCFVNALQALSCRDNNSFGNYNSHGSATWSFCFIGKSQEASNPSAHSGCTITY